MSYPYRKPPFKAAYLVYVAISTLFIRIPFWILLGLPRFMRPRKAWDLRRTVMVNFIRYIWGVEGKVGTPRVTPDHRAIVPGPNVSGVWVSPVPNNLIVGKLNQWAEYADVTSTRIPGYWIHKKGVKIEVSSSAGPGEKVVLALHGGGYTRLSAHPNNPIAAIPYGLLKYVDDVDRVFSVEYRLSSGKPFQIAHPFPTALIDALAAYLYLVNEIGFSPSDIIIEGDSAGGNLAHGLTRYLVEYEGTPGLPGPPGALLLLSPWVDLGQSHNNIPNGSALTFLASDYLNSPFHPEFKYLVNAFVGPHGIEAAEINPYISPASLNPSLVVKFKGFPRTFIVSGGAEILRDQIRTFRDKLFRDLGEGNGVREVEGKTRYFEAPDGVHDYLAFPWHEPEREDTFKAIAEWIAAA
ncbi:alpha/beta-hydrolase [Macrolepiota fuliginosa MF-IS2]|uniref:Alpha/beta-hydrolase n=1 Tax=Macrolepiota fuliginosa MF-IS2 TaxID=1400762 RepID=A0A9P5X8L3_9AGAR|nr:alpha/beta-hydrolase [Macrolepiota fuliginosa MF-IS2]